MKNYYRMRNSKPHIFLRNDDVRGKLDPQLISLTELCIELDVPLSHAVEPANVSLEVADWLLDIKNKHPMLIEIIQHGFDHNYKNPRVKMEFGGTRNYDDQLISIKEGKNIMDDLFGDKWSPVFTFPYGSYNYHTLKAVNDAGYKAISSKINFSTKHRIKNTIGRAIGADFIFDKKISYHDNKRPHFNFLELSVSANVIKKYTGTNTAQHYNKEEILNQIYTASKYTKNIGLLFHHRFHSNELGMFRELIIQLKQKGYFFSTIMNLMR